MTYDVYGIGNALVDYEFEFSDQVLQGLGFDKGLMTLIERDQEQQIFEKLKAQNIDRKKRACGGSAANTLIAVSQLGAKSFYSCKVGDDGPGNFYWTDLKSEGVDSNLHERLYSGETGSCVVMVTPDAERTMATHLGITSTLGVDQVNLEALKKSNYLYIEGYLVASPSGHEAAIHCRNQAKDNNTKVALTFSDVNMVKFFKPQMEKIVGGGVDLIFANEEEGKAYYQTEDLKVVAEKLKGDCQSFALTRGEQGVLLWDGDKEIEVPAHKTVAKDSNGAGDMFAGAFLYGLSQGWNFEKSGRLACRLSAEVVSQYGPRLAAGQSQKLKAEFS